MFLEDGLGQRVRFSTGVLMGLQEFSSLIITLNLGCPIPLSPTFEDGQILQGSEWLVIASKNASWILPFDILLVFGHLHYSFWDLIDLFEGKGFKLFIPPFLKFYTIHFPSPI